MKKKLIASLIATAIAALVLMPAAFAAPACPLKNATTGTANATLSQVLGSNGSQTACPKTAALQSLLNGAVTGTPTAAPTTLQDLLSKLGINKAACQKQNNCANGACPTSNCTTADCPTGNCQAGNCLTVGCPTGTCPNK